MFQFLRKPWIAASLVLVAVTVAYASCGCNKQKEAKPNQLVLDKIVNELVCQAPGVFMKNTPPRFGMTVDNIQVKLGDKYWA